MPHGIICRQDISLYEWQCTGIDLHRSAHHFFPGPGRHQSGGERSHVREKSGFALELQVPAIPDQGFKIEWDQTFITRDDLIGTLPLEGDRYAGLFDQLTQPVFSIIRKKSEGLLLVMYEPVKVPLQIIRCRGYGEGLETCFPDDFPDESRFVFRLTREYEGEGNVGADVSSVGGCAYDRRGVNAATQRVSEGHIALLPEVDGVLQQLSELPACLREIEALTAGRQMVPSGDAGGITPVDAKLHPGLELPDTLKKCDVPMVGYLAVEEIEEGFIGRLERMTGLQQSFDLGSEHKMPTLRIYVIERLDTIPVACHEKGARFLIVYRKGPHPVEPVEAILPPLPVGVEDDFSIGIGVEPESCVFQFLTQRLVIVDLAIEDDVVPARLIGHGLMAMGGEIDNG